jgi:HEAT repeat protein
MMRKLTLTFCVSFLMSVSFCVSRTASDVRLTDPPKSPMGEVVPKTACLAENDVLSALRKLSSGGQSGADQARELLLNESKKSPGCRNEMIAAVVRAMDKPDLGEPDSYHLWDEGAQLLGELKAAEALHLLVGHLDLSDGLYSRSMRHRPAINALIKMGSIAVPELSDTLLNNSNKDIRMGAAYCLTTIGLTTPDRHSHLNALQQALRSESDQCVRNFIRLSINALGTEPGSGSQPSQQSQDEMKILGDWDTAFASGC